ncbi:hypothetical protein HDU67_007428 [Dinochytrium kinnereticum]|nr:hypothetical protein HDU67_007428 [Dinochytrium kinnereticum]
MGLFGNKTKKQLEGGAPLMVSPSPSMDSGYLSSGASTGGSSSRYQRFVGKKQNDGTILCGPLPKVNTLPRPAEIDRAPKPPKECIEPLMRGIWYHELECLDASTYYFSVAANGGSQLGLFLYAIHLRHGWGIAKDETAAVKILVRTAEAAVGEVMMDDSASASSYPPSATQQQRTRPPQPPPTTLPDRSSSRTPIQGGTLSSTHTTTATKRQSCFGVNTRIRRIASEELSFALFELSQCFRQGWGVKRDKDTGMYYLKVAAQLGDMDAQLELAEAYMRGDGIRADKKKAAQMYRLALAQGADMPGMHWVYKEKYDDCAL